jgi:hypothetical protein
MNRIEYTDRLRRALQDGETSDGEVLSLARLEDLSDQVMQQTTPTGTQFQVRFSAVPTQNYVATFVMPDTLVAFADGNPGAIIPTIDVDSRGLFTLPHPPAEQLQVTYVWCYFQDPSLEAFLDESRAWASGPSTFATLEAVPDGLTSTVIDYAASKSLRALAAKIMIASARAGDSGMDFGELTKAYSSQAKDKQASAEAARRSYWGRADQPLAPVGGLSQLAVRQYQPRR